MFDISSLSGNDLATVENLSGASIASIGDTDKPMIKGLYALAFVIKRKQDGNAALKFNDVLALTLAEVNEIVGFNEEVDEDSEEGESDASDENETA